MRSGAVALLGSWCRDRWQGRPWLFLFLIASVIVAVIIVVPFLLFAMLIGSRLLAVLVGPVNIWNPPYQIWYNIGDPDNEKGLTFIRDNP